MSTNVGAVDFELLLNSNPFNKGLKSANTQIKSSGIENSLKSIGKIAAAAFSVGAIVKFGKECIDLGSDLTEVQNVVDVTFGNLNSEVDRFAQNAIDKFGLGQTVTKKYVGTFGAMAKAFDFNNQAALEMSETLTGLVGDVASFYNLSSDLAYTKLKSVFTGETETLKDLGVVMTQNALDQYALANGYGKTTAKMSEQEKVALRYKFVLDKLSLANGDFARTSDGWANQTRVLSLRFNELKATLGQGFINVFTPIVKGINWVLSKLQVLANAFKSFTEMIFGNAGGDKGASSLSNIASEATNASDAIGGIGDAAKKAGKEAKKASNNLATFDNLNVRQQDTDSSSGSGAGAGMDMAGLGDFSSSVMSQVNSGMDSLLDKVKSLFSIFKEGFSISFGNTNFDGILKHLDNIKKSVIDIWQDKDVLNSAKQWADTVLYSLGQVTGSIARIGVSLVEGFIGSIDKYIIQNLDRVKEHICNMFDISSEDMALTGNLWQALGEISDIFRGDTAKQIGADLIAMFTNPLMSTIETIGKFINDLKAIFFQPIIDNATKIKTTLENVMKPIQTFTGTLAEALTYVGDKWNEVYDAHIHPLLESIKTGLSDTFGKFLDVYNTYIVPFLDSMGTKFSELWNTHLKPFVDKVSEFIGAIADLIKTLWEGSIKPFIDWVVENIIPVLMPIFESIGNTIGSLFGLIIDVIGGIIETFTGLINFIVGIFTGDWDKAWEGIKQFFSGIWNAISSVVTTVWNNIKGAIETAINVIKAVITTVFNAIKTTISNIFNGIKNTASSIWNGITSSIGNAVNNIKNGITNAFQTAYNKVTSIFSRIGSFFSGIWNTVKNTFSKLGTSIGSAISNAVKSGINGVISMIQNTINKAINLINGAIGIINNIPGVNIGKLRTLTFPRLAEGGYVKANTPQLAMIGDNKHQGEVVAPEDKMLDMILTALKMFKEQDDSPRETGTRGETTIVFKFTGELAQLARILKPELDAEAKRKGFKLVVEGGTP